MVQAANVNVGLNLESASFVSGAAQARSAMQKALAGIQQDASTAANALQGITTGIKGLAAGFAAGLSISTLTNFGTAIVKAGDQVDQLKAKLNLSVGEGAFTQVALSAEKLGVSVESVGATMARLGNALREVGTSQADLTTVTETLVQMGRIAGSTGQEIESALTQFSQGLSKGRLDGDELKSVLEAMPPLARALAEELGVSAGELRDLGAEGKITAEVAIQAILKGAQDINTQFNSLGENLGQSTAKMQNSFQALFAQIDKDLGASTFFKFLQGGAADMADKLRGQLEKGGIAGALFGTLATGGPEDPITVLQTKLKGLQDQISVQQSRGQTTVIALLEKEAVATAAEIERLTVGLEKLERTKAHALRSDVTTPGSGRKDIAPSGISSQALFGDTTKQQIEDQKKAVEELARAEQKFADTRQAAAEKAANQAKAAQENIRRIEEQRSEEFAEALRRDQEELDRHLEDKQRAYADAYQNIADENEQALRDEQTARDRAAEVQADIYAQPFKDLATNLSNTLSSGIQDALSGDFDFTTFAEGFGDIFADTLASSITAALTPFLTDAAKSFGDALTNALKGGTAGGGAPMSWQAAGLAGMAGGGIVGGLYGQYAPGMKPGNQAGLGGAIGGGIGAAAFGVPGFVVGTAAGSFLGGMIGGQNNLGNDRSAQAYRSGRGITYGDTSFSPENRNITQGILDQVAELEKALETMGGAIEDFGLRIEAGNKSGITVGGKKYPDAQAALAASLEILIGNTTGLGASQQTVLANTKAKDASGIAADLDFAAQFDAMTATGADLDAALKALDGQMQQFARRAGELGLSVDAVAAAHQREAQALIEAQTAQQNQVKAAIQALAPTGGNQVELQLGQLNDRVQELAKAATAAGLPLDELAAAHQRAAVAVVAANEQLQNSVLSQIEALAPSGNVLELQLSQLNDQVQELARSALAAGLPLDALAAAHQRAAAAVVAAHAQLQANLRTQVSAIDPGSSPLQGQLDQLNNQVQGLAANLTAAGMPLDELAAAHGRAAAKIISDYREAQRAQAEAAAAQRQAAAEQKKMAAEQARIQAAVAKQQLLSYQAKVLLLEADPLDAALVNIRDNIRGLIEEGKPLGLTSKSEAEIRAAGGRLETTARTRFKLDQDSLIQQLRGMGAASSDSAQQLAELDITFRELKLRATEYLIPLSEVTAAQARATQALKDQIALQKSEVQERILSARGESGLTEQLRRLDVEMRDLAKAAAAVGIPVAEVTAAHVKAAENLRLAAEVQKQSILDQINAAGGSNTLAEQLRSLDVQMRELGRSATEVGIPLTLVTAAHTKAAAKIREEFEARKRALVAQVDELGQFGTPLQRSLGALKTQVEELQRELIAAGLPIDQLALAHTRAAQRIRDEWDQTLREMQKQLREMPQAILEAQRGAAGAVDAFLNPFKEALSSRGIGQGVYSGATLTESGLKEFREIMKQARTGDTGALGSLVGVGQATIQQARATYGSTEAFAKIFKEVEAGLREQRDTLEAKRDQLLTQIGFFTKETVDELIRLRTQAVADLRADFAKLSRDLVVAVEAKA